MDKIALVDKPKNKKSRWDIFIIHYETKDGEKYDAYMFEEEYNATMFKKHLLENGISEYDLDRYEELLRKKFDRDRTLERT